MKELKDLIREQRARTGKTLEQIGKEIGVAKATVQRWESGEIKNMRRDKLVALARALETTPSYLIGWEECNTSSFGTKLKAYRQAAHLTQEKFARLLGTTKQVLSRYERGERVPKIDVVQQFSARLGIPIDDLIDSKGEHMKIYTIIGGVNGAGKSSLTGVLKAERSDLGKIIDVDRLAVQCGGFLEGGKRAVLLQQQYIAEGISFTQETTLSGQRPLRMIREAREAGYFIRLFYVGIGTVEEALARIRNRVAKGGHDIPTADVVRRFDERFPALLHVLDYVDEAVLYDNENGFRVVAEYRNGELLPIGPSPAWLKELMALLEAAGRAPARH